ncbi:MAG: alpha/beta hydrolase [Pirellula sp.]|jgi:acetyl esterase/lipase|nr:alpha/beta hydrolase [Pirellula sp.]
MARFLVIPLLVLGLFLWGNPSSFGHEIKRDLSYSADGHKHKKLDLYIPLRAKDVPVVVWIHGGGWQVGDKSEVHIKPEFFNGLGYLFVSVNYRLLPEVEMEAIVNDVAESIGWVHKNIAQYGGDPDRLLIMGHSAGAQLAALLCTDYSYLESQSVPLSSIKLCVPIDGDTYDIPAMIDTAEIRQKLHGLPLPDFGHRVKFGNTPEKHLRFSPVTHVLKGRPTPHFLIFYVVDHPDVTAQAFRFRNALQDAGAGVTCLAAHNTSHSRINAELGNPDTDTTKSLLYVLKDLALPSELAKKSSP